MRFRKRINICKGVKLNLSGSGVSCTVGGKGLSLNLGKNGVFLNTSVPGTGLYDRRKLFDFNSLTSARGSAKENARDAVDVRAYELAIGENGAIGILRRDGARVSEEEARRVRRTEWYQQESEALAEQLRREIEAQTEAFAGVYRRACRVSAAGAPEQEKVVEAKLNAWLEAVELPMCFDVEYEYDASSGSVMLDVDLPEIEDIPDDKLAETSGGVIRTKDKTQKELREEYHLCVLGLAVYLVSHVFQVSAGISSGLASGYTQRRNRSSGELEDCYIYSIAFERDAFESDLCSREDPRRFCDRFRSRIKLLASGELGCIVPYTPAEFQQMLGERA